MAKRIPQMASENALNNFKAKISDSLPLLGFLNNEDKEDIWRFWKTVSSAVKIAVNGKGDIVETPRRNSKSSKYTRERQLEEYRLQQLDRGAITIYAPVKCSEKGYRKFRILKLANQKKLADYYETLPILDGEESASDIPFPEADLDNLDFSAISNCNDIEVSKVTSDLTGHVATKDDLPQEIDEDLKAVSSFLKVNSTNFCAQTVTFSESSTNDNEKNSVKAEKQKPVRKIWPVGRPATRSSTGARVIRDKCSVIEDSKLAVKKNCISESSNDKMEVDSITFYPTVKEEATAVDDEDFNITIVPVGNSVMQISENTLANIDEHLQDDQSIISQQHNSSQLPNTSMNPIEESIFHHSENAVTAYQMQVVLPEISLGDSQESDPVKDPVIIQEGDNSVTDFADKMVELQAEIQARAAFNSAADEHKNEQQIALQTNLTPRNASDIETIISALEEELKKTGSSASAEPSFKGNLKVESDIVEMQGSYDDSHIQTVQILEGEEIVEVQHVGNVIWTTGGEVQIVGSSHVVDSTSTVEGTVVYEGQPVEAQYDVVEYEILADKKLKRGRKKKPKDETGSVKAEIVDRTCPICHRILNYASSMTAHMRIHTGVRPYSCGQCDRRFTTKANRDRHEATHVGLKPFQCSQCSKSFTEKRSLKIHTRTHTGERPFVCTVCGRGFTQKCTLIVHMDRHTNKKGHLCDLCGKAFRQKCQLDVHVKRHKRQASYPCNECSTKCYTKGDLVRHMIKHTGERPFRCQLCSRAFTRKQYLIDHENQHYGRKPYRCSVCSATFHDMGSCHRHLRKHKQDEEGENNKGPMKSALLSSTDFHRILEGTQIGQILKLDDGSEALVKAVTAEADGSTVYHITCIGKSVRGEKMDESAAFNESPDEAATQDGITEASD